MESPTLLLHRLVSGYNTDENVSTFGNLVRLCCQEEEGEEEASKNADEDQQPDARQPVNVDRMANSMLKPGEDVTAPKPLASAQHITSQKSKQTRKTKSLLNLLEATNEKGMTLLHYAVNEFTQAEAESAKGSLSNLESMIRLLLDEYPQGIYSLHEKKTPYQVLTSKANDNTTRVKDTASKEQKSKQEKFKECCIGNLGPVRETRSDQIKYLYPNRADERNIECDMNPERKLIDSDYLQSLEFNDIQYETVLRYVHLPLHSSKQIANSQDQPSNVLNDMGHSKAYAAVFQWLKDNNVRKIFRVRVDDICLRPHSESVIQAALSKFEIENLDWRKLDIRSDTIVAGAPKVKILRLYWSGIRSVLQGWACKDGLCRLVDLEKVYLFKYMGKDEDTVLNEWVTNFIEKLEKRKQGIQIIPKTAPEHQKDGSHRYGSGSRGPSGQKQNLWLRHMDNFNRNFEQYEFKLNGKPIEPVVKIALIDDGVNIDNKTEMDDGGEGFDVSSKGQRFTDKVEPTKPRYTVTGGTSFYDSPSDDQGFHQFFVAPGGHGTTMANFIGRVCPKAKLYAIRLNDAGRNSSGSKFTVKSCDEAIEWAIDNCNADSISMSWSFQEDAQNKTDVERFKSAVERAHRKHKILFASLHDEGSGTDYKKFLPMSMEQVIRIGSSTSFGKLSELNTENSIHFALPGVKVPPDGKEVTGSSVATAIAAGLGALVIYCAELAKALGITVIKDPHNTQVMKEAFENIVSTEELKCPIASKAFPETFPIDEGPVAAQEALKRILTKLGF